MRTMRFVWKIFAGIIVLTVLSGCLGLKKGSAPDSTRYYLLSPISAESAAAAAIGSTAGSIIGVGPVNLPPLTDRPQIALRTRQNEVRFMEFARWAEPLRDNFKRVLADNLSLLLGTDNILLYPWKTVLPPDYQVLVEVIRFDGTPAAEAVLQARWSITDSRNSKMLVFKQTRIREPVQGNEMPALVAAESRALAALSREIAAALLDLFRQQTQQ